MRRYVKDLPPDNLKEPCYNAAFPLDGASPADHAARVAKLIVTESGGVVQVFAQA